MKKPSDRVVQVAEAVDREVVNLEIKAENVMEVQSGHLVMELVPVPA